MVKSFIFDLGNVLINFNHNIAAGRIASKVKNFNLEKTYQLFFDSDYTRAFEEGRILPFEFFMEIKKVLDFDMDYEEFIIIWNEIFYFTEENSLLLSLAQQLKKRFPVLVLSNINKLHYDYLADKFPFIFDFTYRILSFEAKLVKPNPLIYKQALSFLGTKPQDTIYVDDRKDLIDAASGLGINAIHFKNTKDLFDKLVTFGIPDIYLSLPNSYI